MTYLQFILVVVVVVVWAPGQSVIEFIALIVQCVSRKLLNAAQEKSGKLLGQFSTQTDADRVRPQNA